MIRPVTYKQLEIGTVNIKKKKTSMLQLMKQKTEYVCFWISKASFCPR